MPPAVNHLVREDSCCIPGHFLSTPCRDRGHLCKVSEKGPVVLNLWVTTDTLIIRWL